MDYERLEIRNLSWREEGGIPLGISSRSFHKILYSMSVQAFHRKFDLHIRILIQCHLSWTTVVVSP